MKWHIIKLVMIFATLYISCKDPVKNKLSGEWNLNYITIENQNPYVYEKVDWISVCKETIYKFEIFPQEGTLTLAEDGKYLLSINGFLVYKERSQFCKPVHDTTKFSFSENGFWSYIKDEKSIQFKPSSNHQYKCPIMNFDGEELLIKCSKQLQFTYQIGFLNSRTITTKTLQLKGTRVK